MPANKITIGNVEVTSLSDGLLEFEATGFFPSVPIEDWLAYEGVLTPEHHFSVNMGSYLVRSDGHTILVDTGLGPKPEDAPDGPGGELLVDLSAKGIRPSEIDMVVMTHLHRDHVGWNVFSQDGVDRPTFPNARYWASAVDWEHFRQPDWLTSYQTTRKCVLPLVELGLLEFMDGEHALTSELTTLPTPGHTPGHMSIVISSQGESGLILGDVAHHPLQVHETSWCSRADIDPETATATRRSLVERLEREGTTVLAGHFTSPGFGKLVRLDGRRQWQAL